MGLKYVPLDSDRYVLCTMLSICLRLPTWSSSAWQVVHLVHTYSCRLVWIKVFLSAPTREIKKHWSSNVHSLFIDIDYRKSIANLWFLVFFVKPCLYTNPLSSTLQVRNCGCSVLLFAHVSGAPHYQNSARWGPFEAFWYRCGTFDIFLCFHDHKLLPSPHYNFVMYHFSSGGIQMS